MSDFSKEGLIIAVDFDGTIVEDKYPEIGEPYTQTIKFLKDSKEQGHKLILWTCRTGAELDEAIQACRSFGLEFDAVNDNLPEIQEKYQDNARKVYADIYYDDKAVKAPLNADLSGHALRYILNLIQAKEKEREENAI